ncbi:unnamed protein product, partial [Ectocarpus sp. 12 AP-2014]
WRRTRERSCCLSCRIPSGFAWSNAGKSVSDHDTSGCGSRRQTGVGSCPPSPPSSSACRFGLVLDGLRIFVVDLGCYTENRARI